MAQQLQVQIFVSIRKKLNDYLAMPHRLNRLNADILVQNTAIVENLQGLRPVYIRQLKAFETIGTVPVGIEKQGNFVGVGRRDDGFFSSGLMNRDNGSTYRVSLPDSQGKVIRLIAETPDYDARIRSWYYTAVEAGQAAFEPHLIRMDMRMPVMDGYEATKKIKSTIKGQSMIIIALTASVFEEERAVVMSTGCHDFVRKPFREEEIYEIMHKHLGVEFTYEEPKPLPEDNAEHQEDIGVLTPAVLETVPREWINALRQAILNVDQDRISAIAEQICAHDQALGNMLKRYLENFKYDHILTMIGSIPEPGGQS